MWLTNQETTFYGTTLIEMASHNMRSPTIRGLRTAFDTEEVPDAQQPGYGLLPGHGSLGPLRGYRVTGDPLRRSLCK